MYNVKASNLCLPTTIKGGLGSAESRATLCSFYRDTLLHDCMEFWFPRAHDVEYGGFFTSLGRDGALLDSDKSIWFQGRMTWMLATMYLEFEPREEWLRLAKSGIEFLDRYGYAFTGPMYFLVTREGAPLRQRQHYIFSEAFAVIAYAAYGRAIESNYCIEKAQTLLRKIVATLATPGKLLPKVRPLTRPLKGVATPMILLVTAQELRKAVDDPLCTQIINEVIDEIERDFVNEEFKCVLENVGTNGEFYDTWDGRQVNPGHSIELGWFILEEARYRGGDAALTSLGLRIIEWSLKLGWDNKFGGLYYFRDARGLPCTEYWHDMKFWWPHCEALIATLLATKLTGEAHYAAWHEKVFEWSFEHFSDRKWGEWYGYLHRDGTVSTTIKGNHWKGFFHLPRMLLKCWGELQEFNPLQPCGMNTNLMSEKGGGAVKTESRQRVTFLSLICFVAAIGGLLFGFDTAVISGTFGFVEQQFELSKLMVGWFGSAALAGCIAGAMVAGWLGDRFGRKPILLIGAIFFFISALFSAIPPNFSILIQARLIGGVGVGFVSVLAPLYISEFAPAHIRGRMVALYQLFIVISILLAYFSNWLLLGFAGRNPDAFGGSGVLHWFFIEQVWRSMFGAELIPNLLFIILLFLVPESPRWLATVNRSAEALKTLKKLNSLEAAHTELRSINDSLSAERGTLKELLQPGLHVTLMVGLGLSIFGQMTGVNSVIYYGPLILEQAGIDLGGALGYQVALGFINLFFTLIALWKVDSWGRRPLLVWGMAVVALSLGCAGLLFATKLGGGVLIVSVLGIYMACVALSICAVIWVLTPEIFPNRIRGRAVSLAVFANWSVNAINAFIFPWFAARFGMHVVFLSFAAICVVATLFFWCFVPETKGRSLEEIERFFASRRKGDARG